jgi:hypothetical protein
MRSMYEPAGFELVHIDTDNEPADYLNNHWIGNYGVTFPLLMGCGGLFGVLRHRLHPPHA